VQNTLKTTLQVEGQEVEVEIDYDAWLENASADSPGDGDLDITGHRILYGLPEGVTEQDVALALGEADDLLCEMAWDDFMEKRKWSR
jgi:hypothetical protein